MRNFTSTSNPRLAARSLAVLFLAALAGCEEESNDTDGGQTPLPGPPCQKLTIEEECAGRQDCAPLSAEEYIPDRQCITDVVWVGCQSVEWGCNATAIYALNPEGRCYGFNSYCIPLG